jgi:virginiamycin B lyase
MDTFLRASGRSAPVRPGHPLFIVSAALVLLLLACGVEVPDDAAPADPVTEPAPEFVAVEIEEWEVPFPESRPRDPYVGPDGRVWFVGQRTHYVAYLDPETGEIRKYDLEEGTGPHTVIVGDDGTVWIAGNQRAYIGKMDPETGVVEKIPMPDEQSRDPHTMDFDSNGDIWFTMQTSNRIGKLSTRTGEVQVVSVPTPSARPYGLLVDANDRPWSVLFGSNKLATVDPQTMALREIELPREQLRPRRIGITSDGAIWYVDYLGGYLGRYDPATEAIQEWPMPGGSDARPYAMAVDEFDRVWFVETGMQPNRFIGFDPATEEFTQPAAVPSGGGTVRHMVYHAPTGSIWFGADTNTIGRARVKS